MTLLPDPTKYIHNFFHQVAEQSRDAILISNKENKIIYVNPIFTELTGYKKKEVIGKNPNILKSGIQTQEFYQEMWQSILENNEWRGELWNRKKCGELFYEYQHIIALKSKNGEYENFISIFHDKTNQLKEEQHKIYNDLYDKVTKIPNRKRLQQYIYDFNKNNSNIYDYVSITYNDLHEINASYNEHFGNQYLCEIARRFENLGNRKYFAARVSGSSFGLITPHQGNSPQKYNFYHEVAEIINKPICIEGNKIYPKTSIRIVENAQKISVVEDLLSQFSFTSLTQNDVTKQDFYFVDKKNRDEIREEFELSQSIQSAMDNDLFEIFYQTQHNCITKVICGAEALLRWQVDNAYVAPMEFIPVAEKYGLMAKLDEYVVERVFRDIRKMINDGMKIPKIAINISDNLIEVEKLEMLMKKYQISTNYFEFEITEQLIAKNNSSLNSYLNEINKLGIKTSIDDFGTGYSSLARLSHLNVDKLKIDKSFIKDIEFDLSAQEVFQSILAIGKALNLDVIAEGVETESQRLFLKFSGCNNAQGYYFSRPAPIDFFKQQLEENSLISFHDKHVGDSVFC